MICKAVAGTIVDWLKITLEESGQNGFVIGISGGVDSALVSTLCAMTGKPTWVVSMPIYQAKDQLERANDHMNWLYLNHKNVKSDTVNLTDGFEAFKKLLPYNIATHELAMVNIKSRLRMVTLYAYSGTHQLLVAGTGNLIEDFGIGFFTKYGDGGVDLSPIGNLSKSQVWELAKYLGVSEAIITAKPTDGLWVDNRGDEDAIGATYPELEWAMGICEANKWTATRAIGLNENRGFPGNFSDREKQVLNIYIQRHALAQHKLNPIPLCPIPSVLL